MGQFFMQVLNNAIMVSFLIPAVILIRFFFRKMPKWTVCLLWFVVAFKLVFPVHIESIFSLLPSGEPLPTNIAIEKNPQIHSGIERIDNVINPVLQQNFAPQEAASVNPLQVYQYIGMILWVVGIVILITYALVSYILLKRRVRTSVKTGEKIYECDNIENPFILGIVNHGIYLPSGLSDEIKECVLKHEKMHLSRMDHFWKPFGFLILAVYWFQPLCWIAYVLFCRDIEYACDEKATKGESDAWKADYCQALLNCSMPKKMIVACPVAFGEIGVKSRVKNILNYKKPAFWIIISSIIICIIVAVCFATNPRKDMTDIATSESSSCPFGDISNDSILAMSLAYAPNLMKVSKDEANKMNEAFTSASWVRLDSDTPTPDGEYYSIFVYNGGNPFKLTFYGDGTVYYEKRDVVSKYKIAGDVVEIVYNIVNPDNIDAIRDSLIECGSETITIDSVWKNYFEEEAERQAEEARYQMEEEAGKMEEEAKYQEEVYQMEEEARKMEEEARYQEEVYQMQEETRYRRKKHQTEEAAETVDRNWR